MPERRPPPTLERLGELAAEVTDRSSRAAGAELDEFDARVRLVARAMALMVPALGHISSPILAAWREGEAKPQRSAYEGALIAGEDITRPGQHGDALYLGRDGFLLWRSAASIVESTIDRALEHYPVTVLLEGMVRQLERHAGGKLAAKTDAMERAAAKLRAIVTLLG